MVLVAAVLASRKLTFHKVMGNGIIDIIDSASDLITGVLIPLAFALCLLFFFWGVAKYVRSGAGGENAAAEGKRTMIWGIVGLFVAFSIWGIITFIRTELGIDEVLNVERPAIESVRATITF